MDVKQLESFLRVAEAGSFSRAAAQLGMAQPSLSKQIRLLEVELHHSLFIRNGRGVALTEVGRCLQEHARAVVASVQRARDALSELRTMEGTGRVVVGLPPRIARTLTVPLVERFKRSFPKATLTVAEGLSVTLREWLTLGRVDLAIMFEPISATDLLIEPVSSEELVLVGSRTAKPALPERLKFPQAAKYPLILPQMPNTTRVLVEAAAHRARVQVNLSAEVDTLQSILELVVRLNAYSIVPRGVVAANPGLAAAKIQSPAMRARVVLASSKLRPLTALARHTHSMLQGMEIPKLLGQQPA